MKIRSIVYLLLPALALADNATTVPEDEPLLPPLPEELLHPQKGQDGLPAMAQPVVSYRAPRNEEQTWLKLLFVKDTETWPDIFRRMASASHEDGMQMCHGYALWLKGQELLHLRYDDDLSLSGIHADGHAYGVLFVEFSPYGIRVCPMAGFDLTGKNGGVCWQDAATKLWSWAEAEQFWSELPKLLKSDKGSRATSAQDTAVKREVATKGQRMVVFWAPPGFSAKTWWPSFARLHAAVGPHRFSLVAADGLKLWADVVVPAIKPSSPAAPAPAASTPASAAPTGAAPMAVPAPSAPTPITAAPPLHAATGKAPVQPASEPLQAPVAATPAASSPPATTVPAGASPQATASSVPAAPAPTPPAPATKAAGTAAPHPIPDTLHPAVGNPRDVAPAASVRPWAIEGGVAPVPGAASPAPNSPAATTAPPAATPPASAPTPPPSEQTAPAAPAARTLDSVPSTPF